MAREFQMREVAERVLFATDLETKLALAPVELADDAPGVAIALPEAPGRPAELRIREHGMKTEFPGTNRLDDDRERGLLLHFLANHELLAAELMALVLLRFPEAPKEYRAGVYEAMREEQAHARMYLRRMKECGIAFGELPLSNYFWRIVAPMETPMDFVTRLNLTFEQANLDFSKHYAALFRQVGDTATAAVLEKIHLDEIGHVGHGVKWFRRWKERGETDWDGYRRCLSYPLTPARAKGLAPFHIESRRRAGLDEDFIRRLEVCESSRGRTPVLHWFNPSAESHARAAAMGRRWQPDKASLALEEDLELLMMAFCRKDDALMVRRMPSLEHLARLKQAGYELPELVPHGTAAGRKLGGLKPWAWSPDAVETLRPYAADVSAGVDGGWREDVPTRWFSKEIGIEIDRQLGADSHGAEIYRTVEEVETAIADLFDRSPDSQALLKAPYACSGRGHLRVNRESVAEKTRGWIENNLTDHGAVVVEPWLERVLDFSALYEALPDGRIEHVGFTVMENDAAGRFLGIRVGPKWGNLLLAEVAGFLFREAGVMELYLRKLPEVMAGVLAGYRGPLCVDAMVHRLPAGGLALRKVVEVNVRCTMGRLAWEWMRRSGRHGGRLRLLRKAKLGAAEIAEMNGAPGIFLNDPEQAGMFLAWWERGEG
ncbi:MAG: ferritin-like domain-containing protein [Akkermansiaceae bacterium]|nr:ferritin-like domain-containing protein [Akkermansiaceae bacterium]